MVMVDASDAILMVNRRIERQFGYGREELIGKPLEMLVPIRLREEYSRQREAFDRDPKQGRIGANPALLGLRKDGSEFSIEMSLTPVASDSGRRVLGLIVDTGLQRDADKHRVMMERRYRALLEAAPDPMVVVDRGGTIVLLNLQAERQFGYHRDQLLGQKITRIISDGLPEPFILDALRSVNDPSATHFDTAYELHGFRKAGEVFPIEVVLSPLESAEGPLVMAAIRDVTGRKRAERLKDEFVSTVSHELRTPLTSISGSLSLLVAQWAGKLPEGAARLLAIANMNSQRLVRLINDILDIEKIESGRMRFNLNRLHVRLVVEQTIEANRGFAEGYHVRVRLDPDSVDAEVNSDPDRLAQVITNLISNAIKFSPAEGEVLVSVARLGNSVRISVKDHGSGIPPEFKPHVFEKFAQADGTSTRQNGGTGLGLSIVKEIMERLHGTVAFKDAPGGGTIFNLDLPVWDNAAGFEIDLDALANSARILLCEDDRDTALAMREQLRPAGFAADFAYTAAAALVRAEVTPYSAILVDLQLPDGDGITLILGLREKPQHHETPIIVVSIDPLRGRNDVRSSNLNVMGWLSKPVDFKQLVRTLKASIAAQSRESIRSLGAGDI